MAADSPIVEAKLVAEDGTELVLIPSDVIDVTKFDPGFPQVRQVADVRPDVDGSINRTQNYGARSISAELAVYGDVDTEVSDALDSVLRFLHPGLRPWLHVTWSGRDEQKIELVADNLSRAVSADSPRQVVVSCSWVAPDGAWQGSDSKVALVSADIAAPGTSLPFTMPLTFPAGGGGPITVEGDGTLSAPWQAIVFGPCTGPALHLVETGEVVDLPTLTIASGDWILIDSLERTVTVQGNPAASRFSSIDFTTLSWWSIAPGRSTVRFSVQSGTPAPAWLLYSDRYL